MNRIIMNLDNWTYRDYYRFAGAFANNSVSETYPMVLRLISSWDYSTPLQEGAMDELGLAESSEVVRTVMNSLGNYIENVDTKGIKVDLTVWNTGKFNKWDAARVQGRFDTVEPMARELIRWDALPPEGEFSFRQGVAIYKAISDAYKKIVSGQNFPIKSTSE